MLKGNWERQGPAKWSGNMKGINNREVLVIRTATMWLHIRTKRGGGLKLQMPGPNQLNLTFKGCHGHRVFPNCPEMRMHRKALGPADPPYKELPYYYGLT